VSSGLRREIQRLREEAWLRQSELAELPPSDYGDWTLDEQLANAECKVRFRVAFHSDDEITRYAATDREIHMIGIWCALQELLQELAGVPAKDREGYAFDYTFERSGLTIELTPSGAGEEVIVEVPRRITIDDIPSWLLRHFERMPPEEQPKRDEYLYMRRHLAKEDLAELREMQRRAAQSEASGASKRSAQAQSKGDRD
jgi:hypothetical protein